MDLRKRPIVTLALIAFVAILACDVIRDLKEAWSYYASSPVMLAIPLIAVPILCFIAWLIQLGFYRLPQGTQRRIVLVGWGFVNVVGTVSAAGVLWWCVFLMSYWNRTTDGLYAFLLVAHIALLVGCIVVLSWSWRSWIRAIRRSPGSTRTS
jgi:hypothetical protein